MYSIGDKIAYLRKKMGLKQEELAEKLDISRQSLLNYETEKRQIPIDILSKIASFFKIPIEAFFLDDYDEFK